MNSRYARDEMVQVWTDQARFAAWLDVELAVLAELEDGGVATAGSADSVRERVHIDPERILEIEAVTHHDVIAFLTHVEEQAGEAARQLHFGLTSSDVLDTALALQIRAGMAILEKGMGALLDALSGVAHAHKRTPVMGRTHGIHGEPITIGLKFARFFADTRRAIENVRHAAAQLEVGKLSGAVGAFSILDPSLEEKALARLELSADESATQVISRDRHATLLASFGILASVIERIAVEIRHSQRTEVGELAEAFAKGQKGSSAMPHKRNPILSENLTGLARLIRRNVHAAMEDIALWHERDISHSSVERVILPESFVLLDFSLHRLARLLERLVVNESAAAKNLAASRGLYASQKILSMLIEGGLARQGAYDLVKAVTTAVLTSPAPTGASDDSPGDEFIQRCMEQPELVERLGEAAIRSSLGLGGFLRHIDVLFDRIFTGAKADPGAP